MQGDYEFPFLELTGKTRPLVNALHFCFGSGRIGSGWFLA